MLANRAPGSFAAVRCDGPPWRLSGSVYSALLNHAPQLSALGDSVNQPPYKAPPRAPVLEIKPRHMLAADGSVLRVPAGQVALQVGASLGIVVGRVARRVPLAGALEFVAGYVLVGDICVPVPSHYRPGARFKARDGFCPLGALVVATARVPAPEALCGSVAVDGVVVHTFDTAQRVRGMAQLLVDVTEFMTLQAGDVLALGVSHGAPLVAAGHDVRLEIDGVGTLGLRLQAEERHE